MTLYRQSPSGSRGNNVLVRGGRALLVSEVVAFLVPLLVLPHLTRRLGVDAYGRLQYVVALGMMAGILADPGLGRVAIRRSARRPDRIGRLVSRLQPLRFIAAVAASVLLVGGTLVAGGTSELTGLVALQSGVILAQSLSSDGYLLGIGASAWIGYARAAASLFYGVGVLVWVRDAGDARAALSVTLAMSVLVTIAGFFRLRATAGAFRWALAARPSRALFREAFGFGLSSVMSLIYARIDVIMLRWLRGEAAVGVYSSAVRLTEAPLTVLGVVNNLLYPKAITASRRAASRLGGYAQRALRIVSAIVVPAAVGAAVAGGPILAWIAGPEFAGGDWVMATLGMATLTGAIASVASGFGLSAQGRTRALLHATSAGALVNVAGNVIAIPLLGGVGAALTTVLAQSAVAAYALRASRDIMRLSLLRAVLPWLPPAVLMGAVVCATRLAGGSAPTQLGVGVASYGIGVLIFRSLRSRERAGLAALLSVNSR